MALAMITGTMRVGDALEAFLTLHGMNRASYRARRFVVEVGGLALPLPNPGFLAVHDLHHVALDLAPTFWGEVEVSAFELRGGTPSFLVAFLCVAALFLGTVLSPRRVARAWTRHRHARSLYGERYEELLALDLDALRRRMRREPAAGPGRGAAA